MRKSTKNQNAAPENVADESSEPRDKMKWWEELEADFSASYETRYNIVLGQPEFRRKGKTEWRPVQDRDVYSMVRHLRRSKGNEKVSKDKLTELIISDFSPAVDPLQDYFSRLPDAPGAIARYAELLTLAKEEDRDLFLELFRKWIIATVANVFEEDKCANHTCIIFTGEQGIGKSKAISALVPDELISYYYEGALNPESKDSQFSLAENFIINLDDSLAGITAKAINELKALLTINRIKQRRVYDRFNTTAPRRASFAACSNEVTFLHDATGNRRFMPFELSAIDHAAAKSFPLGELWGEAFHAYKRGEVYWIAGEELDRLAEHNQDFEVQTPEYETVVKYFQLPDQGGLPEHLTATDVMEKLRGKGYTTLSMKKLGEALRKAGFERKKRKVGGNVIQAYTMVEVAPGIPSEPCAADSLVDQGQDAGEKELPF